MKTIHLEFANQHNYWCHYGSYHHLPSLVQQAKQLSRRTGKRYRIIDDDGVLLDLIYP